MSHRHPHPSATAAELPGMFPDPGVTACYKSAATGPQGQTLYLSADAQGNVTVQYDVNSNSGWTYHQRDKMGDRGLAFVNQATGQALAMVDGGRLTTVPFDPVGLPDEQFWTVTAYAPFAVRPYANDDLNLNIRGDGPYPAGTEVILFHWDNQPNSKWSRDF